MRNRGIKDKVDHAAVALFAERGVDGVSIADIAAAAGVAQGALYRYYRGKDELAARLFAEAYRGVGAALAEIAASEAGFAERVAAMIMHFCVLYDREPALFRFLLLSQHDLLPRLDEPGPTPAAAIESAIAAAVAAEEIGPVDPGAGAAVIMGIVLQTALFTVYGRIAAPLSPRALALARAAIAGVKALG